MGSVPHQRALQGVFTQFNSIKKHHAGWISALIMTLTIALAGCSKSGSESAALSGSPVSGPIAAPTLKGPVIDAGSIREGTGQVVTLSNGVTTYVQMRGGVPYFEAQGTFTDAAFQQLNRLHMRKPLEERKAAFKAEIKKLSNRLSTTRGVEVYEVPEVGYFVFQLPYESADLFASTKGISLDYAVMMAPVSYDAKGPGSREEGPMMPLSLSGLSTAARNPRGDTRGYTGLDAIHAPEFVKIAEADIGGGVQVDGSSVLVGVADTGVTLNHPSFQDASGQSRIVLMKDYTKEGRVYFNKNAKFEVVVDSEQAAPNVEADLLVNAQVVVTPKLPMTPVGDVLAELKDLRLKVSPALRAVLTTPGSGAKLGILDEEVFQSSGDVSDISGNGTLKTKILMILIPGESPQNDVVYVDPSGTGDFRNAQPVGDWNLTHASAPAFAERLGFTFQEEVLPSMKGKESIPVRSLSLVGFDPGGHGTHVSGLVAARKFISNDRSDTLARGVAPASRLAVDRVCSNNGHCEMAQALIDLALNHAEVVNVSIGGLNAFNDGYDIESTLINRLSKQYNTLYVLAAGNDGPGRQTVGSPSTSDSALSVGATATRGMIQRQYQWAGSGSGLDEADRSSLDADFMLYFSGRGPSANGGFKPNITAPGAELSTVPLNTAQGEQGGLDVKWGTSMAAPTVAGAYALFLDAIKKYNLSHPAQALPTDAITLRKVLIDSARPFDVNSYDPVTGARSLGQYTWIDEGTGMMDLVAAWKKVFEVRDHSVGSPVLLAGKPVDLEYEVLAPLISPQGLPYDGSRGAGKAGPAFGKGLYLNYFGKDTLRQVGIARRLPADLAQTPDAGALTVQLTTTQEEFALKTVIYGSDKQWLKAGTLENVIGEVPCADLETANLTVMGQGAGVEIANATGSGALKQQKLSALNICLDRKMMTEDLPPGDHGALIYGYRVKSSQSASGANSEVDVLPAFIVPVYLTVPHHTLANSTAFDVNQTVRSFQVQRNYIAIPPGTTLVRVTLETPPVKLTGKGNGRGCSGVEFMPLTGSNRADPFKGTSKGLVLNCNGKGEPKAPTPGGADGPDRVSFVVQNPAPGIWDLPVLGFYQFSHSTYRLRVDYLTAKSNVPAVQGPPSVLNGTLNLSLKESTFSGPDSSKSSIALNQLVAVVSGRVANGERVWVAGPTAGTLAASAVIESVSSAAVKKVMRSYPAGVSEVTIMITGTASTKAGNGKKTANDLDLFVVGCPLFDAAGKPITDPTSSECSEVGSSDGPTDTESVTFIPKSDKLYAVQVAGAQVGDEGMFSSLEMLTFPKEVGQVQVTAPESESQLSFQVSYGFTPEQLSSSKLLAHPLFISGKYTAVGALRVVASDGQLLYAVPVTIFPPSMRTQSEL